MTAAPSAVTNHVKSVPRSAWMMGGSENIGRRNPPMALGSVKEETSEGEEEDIVTDRRIIR